MSEIMEQNVQTPQTIKIPFAHTKPIYVASYSLIVRDLEKVSQFYQNIVGLNKISGDTTGHALGVEDRVLLYLEPDLTARAEPQGSAGLFHIALLLPSRKDLAHYLRHAKDNNIAINGAADHVVSEAIYLTDPEGNEVELYCDRPQEDWAKDDEGYVMDTLSLHHGALLAIAPVSQWGGLPAGTGIGHIHLSVGDIRHSEVMFTSLGMEVTERYPGAVFFSSGDYHHHVAANMWRSEGAVRRGNALLGLRGYNLCYNDATLWQDVVQHLSEATIEYRLEGGNVIITDPWDIEIMLSTAS